MQVLKLYRKKMHGMHLNVFLLISTIICSYLAPKLEKQKINSYIFLYFEK